MSVLKNISIIIPLAPGEKAYLALLRDLEVFPSETEIILVTTEPLAPGSTNIHVLKTEKGRARQLNFGAHHASKDYLWFLHADSRVSKKSILALETSLPSASHSLFYFNLTFYDGPIWMILNTLGVWIKSHFFGIPFGDQGFFIQKSLFERVGEFNKKIVSGEDHAFVWKTKKAGIKLKCTGAVIKTSARKYKYQGWAKTTLHHLFLTFKQALLFQ